MTSTDRIDSLAAQIVAARSEFDGDEQRVAVSLLRLLARGAPVSVTALAEKVGLPIAQVDATLSGWPGLVHGSGGEIMGSMGLSVVEIGHHRIHLDGRTLSAWCAWDTLFLPELIGEPAHVTSQCPSTGQRISLEVTPEGPKDVVPSTTMVSFLVPETKFDADVIKSFCQYIHFFASADTAATWLAEHPSTFLLSIDDAYRIARIANHGSFGLFLEGSAPAAR